MGSKELAIDVSSFENDLLDLSDFAKQLQKFIEVEHHFVSGSLVIALSSKFGSGKTTFLKMWRSLLENKDSNENENKPRVISLNAWDHDYNDNPLFAIVSSLIESLEDRKESDLAKPILNAMEDIGRFMTMGINQVIKKSTGIDTIEAKKFAKEKKEQRDGVNFSDSFSVYQGQKKAMKHLQDTIKKFVADSKMQVLFFVDELDRCRPDYAILYLETIKHIFDVKGATFILAADRQQLENSAKTAFGADLDFDEYYRKFVQREISLPPITDKGYSKLADTYVSYYLKQENLRSCFKIDDDQIKNIIELIAALQLTPRQIQEAFRIIGHSLEKPEEKEESIYWCLAVGLIAMSVFKVGNHRVFELLGSKQFIPQDALSFLRNILGKDEADWWFKLFITGDGLKIPESTSYEKVMIDLGLMKEGEGSNELSKYRWGSGNFPRRFAQIREKIEQISQWN